MCACVRACVDGHGGEEASHYTHLHLADIIADEINTLYRAKTGAAAEPGGAPAAHVSEEKDAASASSPAAAAAAAAAASISVDPAALSALHLDYKAALLSAFDKLEEQVLRQSRHIGCRDGTTVTTVLVTNDALYCANTGGRTNIHTCTGIIIWCTRALLVLVLVLTLFSVDIDVSFLRRRFSHRVVSREQCRCAVA